MTAPRMSRRAALGGLIATPTMLLLPIGPGAHAETLDALSDGFLAIGEDGLVTVQLFQAEMGQGVYTSLAKAVAEELDADWTTIRVEHAPVREIYRSQYLGIQGTAVSSTARLFIDPLRQAGASARAMLIAAAASEWGVDPAECAAAAGQVTHPASGRSAGYGELTRSAATQQRPANPELKARADWSLLGKSTPRLDTPSKTDGSAVYGIDVTIPGMAHAAIRHSPVFGGKVASIDASAVTGRPGVIEVVDLGHAVAVIAETWWTAQKAVTDLDIAFEPGANGAADDASIEADLRAGLVADAPIAMSEGDPAAALAEGAQLFEADYYVPVLSHLAMEPMNCTASVTADGVDVWLGTQFQEPAQIVAAKIAEVPQNQVRIHNHLLGGGFGRRCEVDTVIEAVSLSRRAGRPIKLIWSREEDVQHDYYRPATAGRIRASLDAEGRVTGWSNVVSGPSILKRVFPARLQGGTIDFTTLQGAVDMPYAIPNREVRYSLVDIAPPAGWWRSVGHTFNTFFIEAALDELAELAGRDALDLRRELLAEHPRAIAVIDRTVELAGPATATGARGFAFGHGYGSFAGLAADIRLDGDNVVVDRLAGVLDCGVAVDPGVVEAQMEGALIFGLSAALWGKTSIEDGAVVESNFHDQRVVTLAELPRIETVRWSPIRGQCRGIATLGSGPCHAAASMTAGPA